MNWKKIGRAFVCVALVLCLLVNCSPIKAKASAVGIGAGLVALLIAGTAGVVFNGLTSDQISALGNSFKTSMFQWGTSAEKLDDVEEFFGGLSVYDPDAPEDPDWNKLKIGLSHTILTGIAVWLATLIAAGGLKVPVEEAPINYAFYNGYLLPEPPDIDYSVYECCFVTEVTSKTYLDFYACTIPLSHAYASSFGFSAGSYQLLHFRSTPKNGVFGPWELCIERTYGNGYNDTNLSFPSGNIVWTNYDAFYDDSLICPGTDVEYVRSEVVEPLRFVELPGSGVNGEVDPEKIEQILPEVIDLTKLQYDTQKADLNELTLEVMRRLANEEMTYEQYISSITPAPEPDPEPSPEPDPEPEPEPSEPVVVVPDLGDGALSNLNVNVFFDTLADIITAPFKWIWEKLETKLDTLKPIEFDFDRLTSIVTAPGQWIWEKIETVVLPTIRSIPNALSDLRSSLETLGDSIGDKIAQVGAQTEAAIESLVVPDKDYLSDKVLALCDEFVFADSIVKTAQALQYGLAGVSTEPPVIYLDLGAFRGSYYLGGTVPFLDLRWYAEYKPTVDTLISAFLWICFAWRMLVKLPGIISGMPGDFVAGSAHAMGISDFLPSRSEDYERQRVELKRSIWKGRK